MNLFGNKALVKISKKTAYDIVKQTKKENFTYLNQTVALKGQTVLAGDSITEIFNYGDLFYNFTKTAGQAVYNRGISGDTSDRLLERWQDNVLSVVPKNIVLLIGTNDLGMDAPIHFIIKNIEEIMKETIQACPETNLIVENVYPVSFKDRRMVGRRRNLDIMLLNKQIEALCKQYPVTNLDLTGILSAPDGALQNDFTYDGLHLNAKGFAKVAEQVIPLLK